MTHIFEGFDIQPAIDARKVLMFEANTYEDCVKLVYRPTYLLVEELLSTNPSELLCLRGPVVFNKDQLGSYCDVDIVCLENKVVYLGTVRDWAQALANWSWFLKIYRDLPEKVDVLVRRGPMAIIRHKLRCDVPVQTKKLDDDAMEDAVRKYLRTYLPDFDSDRPKIKWLDAKQQKRLERQMYEEAKKNAKDQTKEERRRIFGFDM